MYVNPFTAPRYFIGDLCFSLWLEKDYILLFTYSVDS